jgi:hypothetical protein
MRGVEDPPRVTIIDPRAPGRPIGVWAMTPVEVIEGGVDRDPWQPTPKQRRSISVATALTVLVAAAWVAVDHGRANRAVARAEAQAVRLWAEGLQPLGPGAVRLVLRNDGETAVQVVAAELNRPGYGAAVEAATVAPEAVTTLSFADAATCGPHLLVDPVDSLTVTVRTPRGATVRREVTLGPSAFREVNAPARYRCGYLPMEDALRFELLPVQDTEDGVVLHAFVANTSVLPLTLRELLPAAGIELTTTPELPITLTPRDYPSAPDSPVGLAIRLRVRDCSSLHQRTPFDRGLRPARGLQALRAWVLRESSIREISLPLAFTSPGEDPMVEGLFRAVLRRGCA